MSAQVEHMIIRLKLYYPRDFLISGPIFVGYQQDDAASLCGLSDRIWVSCENLMNTMFTYVHLMLA